MTEMKSCNLQKMLPYFLAGICLFFLICNMNNTQIKGGNKKKHKCNLYYAPWCGHCQRFEPVWEKVSNKPNLKNKIKFIKINGDTNQKKLIKDGVEGFPTIRLITDNNEVIEYQGNREEKDFESFLKNNM